MEKPVIGKFRPKFWYFVTTLFLLWILLLYFYYSGVENERIDSSDNADESVIQNTSHVTVSNMDINVSEDPVANFFIGGDWDQFLGEGSNAEKEKPEISDNKTDVGERNEENFDNSVPEDNVFGDVTKQLVNVEDDATKLDFNFDSDSESCSGRYIYVHNLPSQFNDHLLKHCRSLSEWFNMCPFITNAGLGPKLRNSQGVLADAGWFETNQFALEVIFHNRMKQYKCLTKNSSLASAVFVPYYAGLDIGRYLWHSNKLMRDHYSLALFKWLREKPEWKRMFGRDHFMVAGRITWDFRRLTNRNSDWGNRLMVLPESRNMTILTIESSPWHNNDFAIPYPTYFHPSSDAEVFEWQNRMRQAKRQFLFSFAGGPRPKMTESIRSEIIGQCRAARRKCKLLECSSGSNKCYKPVNVMKMFQSSIFCLQPPGDSFTRRSTFDSILAGCIPVFFHPGSAYVQYIWHLPKDYTRYSVFIPGNKVKAGEARIDRILSRISTEKMLSMREELLKMIPALVYADPRSNLETFEDAFDVTLDGVLERVEKIRMDINEGKNSSESAEIEQLTWRKSLPDDVGEHEWDAFFERRT